MAAEKLREGIGLSYKRVDTGVNSLVYGNIQCFKEEYPGQDKVNSFRNIDPFVISQQYGNKKIVVGSVCQLLLEIRRLVNALADSNRMYVDKMNNAKDREKGDLFFEYTSDVPSKLILISSQARNLFHTFSWLTEQYTIPLFAYDRQQDGNIRMKDLLDVFVHNRYIYFDGSEYIDMFSEEPPKTPSERYTFKVNDYIRVIQEVIHGITIKDLITMLRSRVSSLDADKPFNEMVILIQNLESFSDLLGAVIPDGKKYDFMLRLFCENIQTPRTFRAPDGTLMQRILFDEPHIKLAENLSEKKIRISVRCDLSGEDIKSTEPRVFDVDHKEFFDSVYAACGKDSLLALSSRKSGWGLGATR